jgi:hypothetical protein
LYVDCDRKGELLTLEKFTARPEHLPLARRTDTVKIVAFYAHLDNRVAGVALRDATGAVSFRTERTGLWQTLTNADAPRLTLCGRVDLADAQQVTDGNGYAWIERRNTEHACVAA